MNEAQRQFAMGVAGVRLWYARHPLPGAAPSPDFDFGEPAGEPELASEPSELQRPRRSRPAAEASRKGLARLQGLLSETRSGQAPKSRDDGAPESAPTTVADTPRAQESVATAPDTTIAGPSPESEATEPAISVLAGKPIEFQWRFWIGEQWLLVSSCPDSASSALEDRLALNILRALGDVMTRTETLRWPVFSNPAVPGNDAAGAVEVVSAMAKAVSRPKRLWLGLTPEESDPDTGALWHSVSAPLGEATVSFPGSLVALSSDPEAKRALWQALQQTGRS